MGPNVSLLAIHGTNFRNFFLGYKIGGTEYWVVCDASKSNKNFTKDVKDKSLTLNAEPRKQNFDRGSEN
jgi:hypothetical protein